MQTNGGAPGTVPDRAADQLADAVLALLRSWRTLTQRAAEGAAPSTMAVLELVRLLGDGERRLGEIAALRGVDQSVVSRQIGELEARRLVCRRPDPADRRASLVRLTPAGCELLAQGEAMRREWLHGALARLPDVDVLATARLVNALADEITARTAEHDEARSHTGARTSTRGTPA